MTTALVLAGLSVRMTAEAAVRDGYTALALDLFGDLDTRRLAARWAGIGAPDALRIDPGRFLASLRSLAAHEGVIGWVAGSGFEDQPGLLDEGAKILPLIGMPAAAVRRVRDPRTFFAFLAARRIAYPQVRFGQPRSAGWLRKDAGGSGGWHIRQVEADQPLQRVPERHYFQRQAAGTPMSALFVANRRRACVLGFNEQIVDRLGPRPFVYRGAVGPVCVPADVASAVDAAAQSLTAEFGLVGLCSLDFLLDGADFALLEVNPRPSGSMALYGGLPGAALMRSHVQACLQQRLPAAPLHDEVRGTQIVFARRALRVDAAATCHLLSLAHTHDLPAPGATFAESEPVCTVSAAGPDARSVHERLAARRDALLDHLESLK